MGTQRASSQGLRAAELVIGDSGMAEPGTCEKGAPRGAARVRGSARSCSDPRAALTLVLVGNEALGCNKLKTKLKAPAPWVKFSSELISKINCFGIVWSISLSPYCFSD